MRWTSVESYRLIRFNDCHVTTLKFPICLVTSVKNNTTGEAYMTRPLGLWLASSGYLRLFDWPVS